MAAQFLSTPLFVLTFLSFIFSCVVFGLAMFNYSILSERIGVSCAVLTILYHCTLGSIALHRWWTTHTQYKGYYSTTGIALAYTLLCVWLVVFGVSVQITVGGPRSVMLIDVQGRPWNGGIQIGESFMIGVEALVMAIIAVHCTMRKNSVDEKERDVIEEKMYYMVRVFNRYLPE